MPLVFTPGEPAGIGPDLAVLLASGEITLPPATRLVIVADRTLLAARASQLGKTFALPDYTPASAATLNLWHCPLKAPVATGQLAPQNAEYVLETLRRATDGCLAGEFSGFVTGPVHKGMINAAGIPFTGHTEFLAERSHTPHVVMMLAGRMHHGGGWLRVALVTTHLPLSAVAAAITPARLREILTILHSGLQRDFGLAQPHILVAGLNPHAGEDGHLGREEIAVIEPVLAALRGEGLHLSGPLPADTLFQPKHLDGADAVLAMYHDQGLPVLKHATFGQGVNITLGLPFVRTSVDHGTALTLAGSGRANPGSLAVAIQVAAEMAAKHHGAPQRTAPGP